MAQWELTRRRSRAMRRWTMGAARRRTPTSAAGVVTAVLLVPAANVGRGAHFRGFPVGSRLALSLVGAGGIALLCYFDKRDRGTANEPDD